MKQPQKRVNVYKDKKNKNQDKIEEKKEKLKKHFFSRTNPIACFMEWGIPQPIIVETEEKLDTLINAHLTGKRATVTYRTKKIDKGYKGQQVRIGSYLLDENDKTNVGCLDFDGAGHADALDDPVKYAIESYNKAKKLGIPAYIEKSGGGNGYHLWIFCSEKVSGLQMRILLNMILPDNPITIDGKQAKIEVFPKQSKQKGKQVGNMVWLPWFWGAPNGANEFYDVNEETNTLIPEPIFPDFQDTDIELVNQLTKEKLEKAEKEEKERIKQQKEMMEKTKVIGNTSDKNFGIKYNNTNSNPNLNPVSLQTVEEALKFIPPDISYEKWVENGMAIHWLDQNGGYDIFDSWSSLGSKYVNSEETRSKWDSFNVAGGITIGTLFKNAIDYGWQPKGKEKKLVEKHVENAFILPKAQIQVNNKQIEEIKQTAWKVILNANKISPQPILFRRNDKCVQIKKDDTGRIQIIEIDKIDMENILDKIAEWVRITEDGETRAAKIPPELPRRMVKQCNKKLPRLEGVTDIPLFFKDNNNKIILNHKPGYNPATHFWYEPTKNLLATKFTLNPTKNDLETAKDLFFNKLFADFPFEDQSDKANTLTTILSPFVRHLIDSPTPLHLYEAPTPGTGKTLITNLIAFVITNRFGIAKTIPDSEEERRKNITSSLTNSPTIVIWDNINEFRRFSSQAFASLLTSTTWEDRILGSSQNIILPNYTTWVATGNNPTLSRELVDRCLPIRINANVENPRQRDVNKFKIPSIRGWIQENRSALIKACIDLISNWIKKGAKESNCKFGSFESWASVLGGILEANKIKGFLGNLEKFYSTTKGMDDEEWVDFTQKWFETYASLKKKPSDLFEMVQTYGFFSSFRCENENAKKNLFYISLKRNNDKIFRGLKIKLVIYNNRSHYQLEEIDDKTTKFQNGNDAEKQHTEVVKKQIIVKQNKMVNLLN